MGIMKTVILLSYLLAAFLAIAGITMSLLAKKKTYSRLNNAILVFLFGMLAMCFYDWFIYYEDYTFLGLTGTMSLRLGSCLIAVLFYFWIDLEHEIAGGDEFAGPVRMFRIYALSYSAFWLVVSLFLRNSEFYTIKFLLLFTDIVLIIATLLLSVICMSRLIVSGRKALPGYMIIVTSMLLWNYTSFVWGELSVYWNNSHFMRMPLDLTIIFWLAVNVATIYFVYHIDFSKAYSEATGGDAQFCLEERIAEMGKEYSMTNREMDILRLIYKGMSNNEIAEQLFISRSTVKSHIYNTFRKVDVKSRSEIVCLIHDRNYKTAG